MVDLRHFVTPLLKCCIQVVLTNENGEFEYEFKFYVTVEGGMDFRAMLMKRKVKQKKIVQKVIEWIEVSFLYF